MKIGVFVFYIVFICKILCANMKKVHITEKQLKKLTEALTVDGTKEVEAAGGNVNTAWTNMKSKNPFLGQEADKGEIAVSVNPNGIDEDVDESCSDMDGKTFTKRQIKEAKIKKLQENSVMFRKKDLR